MKAPRSSGATDEQLESGRFQSRYEQWRVCTFWYRKFPNLPPTQCVTSQRSPTCSDCSRKQRGPKKHSLPQKLSTVCSNSDVYCMTSTETSAIIATRKIRMFVYLESNVGSTEKNYQPTKNKPRSVHIVGKMWTLFVICSQIHLPPKRPAGNSHNLDKLKKK
jgi:hypothetical protein